MKTIPMENMPSLPVEVAALVRQGIYSMFEVSGSAAKYLLVTSQRNEFYLLGETGTIVVDPAIRSIEDARIVQAVSLSGAEGDGKEVLLHANSLWPAMLV